MVHVVTMAAGDMCREHLAALQGHEMCFACARRAPVGVVPCGVSEGGRKTTLRLKARMS